MKKQLLCLSSLLALTGSLSATLGTLIDDVVQTPGDILYGPEYSDNNSNYEPDYRNDYRYDNGHRGLLGRRNYYRN